MPMRIAVTKDRHGWMDKRNVTYAAAAAKSRQSCPTLCDPIDSSPPPGSSVPGILQARILEWAAISCSNAWNCKVKVKSLSRVRLFATPWTAAYQAPLSMGFSRQEYWSALPLPSPDMLSRLVITVLPRSKHLNFMTVIAIAMILEPPKIKSDTVSTVSPSVSMKWWDQMPWSSFSECWALSQLFHSPLSSRGFLVPLHFLP